MCICVTCCILIQYTHVYYISYDNTGTYSVKYVICQWHVRVLYGLFTLLIINGNPESISILYRGGRVSAHFLLLYQLIVISISCYFVYWEAIREVKWPRIFTDCRHLNARSQWRCVKKYINFELAIYCIFNYVKSTILLNFYVFKNKRILFQKLKILVGSQK